MICAIVSCLRKVIDHKRQLGCVSLEVKYDGWKTLERNGKKNFLECVWLGGEKGK